MAWNIQGLKGKLRNVSFRDFCEKFKIFAFSEIWSCKQDDIVSAFPDFRVFLSPRTQRLKGGVAVCVHKDLVQHVEQLLVSVEDSVFLKIGKSALNSSSDLIAAFVYVAPEHSVIYGDDNPDGIETLNNRMTEVMSLYPDLPWFVCGDFNARTACLSENDSIGENTHAQPLQELDDLFDDMPQVARKSKDGGVNRFGHKLIELCNEFGLCILNGRTQSDYEGEITCVANRGKSVVDYCICSRYIFDTVADMYVANRCESDHFPVVTSFSCQADDCCEEEEEDIVLEEGLKFAWKDQYAEAFGAFVRENVDMYFRNFERALYTGVEEGLTCFIEFIQTAAGKMRSRSRSGERVRQARAQPPWWDEECEVSKQTKYRQLKLFRMTNSHEDLNRYLDLKKDFKSTCKTKQAEYNTRVLNELNEACSDTNSKSFWQKIRSLTSCKTFDTSSMSPRVWYDYFQKLLNVETSTEDSNFGRKVEEKLIDHTSAACDACTNAELDTEITQDEILRAIDSMKKSKAPGPDGLPSEFFSYAKDVSVKFLHPLFNRIFDSGEYPESWSKAVIFPLHKKGNPRKADNYRGISLLSTLSKLYSTILNNRLSCFCEDNDRIPESQAGFRKGYSTTDNIFSLQSLIQKYLTKQGGRFYTLFVDFSKAYDSVHRMKLLYALLQNGIHGKMYRTLESMYKHVKAAVRVGSKVTEYFDCLSGVRQGCVLSPLLFSIFLAELQAELTRSGSRGIDICADPIGVLLLMYADDIALVSDSVADLQKKINCLEQYCKDWGLSVNMDKTKAVVFKNGGFIKNCEKWYYAGKQIKVESHYTYLGVIFASSLKWSKCVSNLSNKALRALAGIKRLFFKLKNMPAETVFKIFDVKIKPILLYGSEIWGLKRYEDIEKVQIKMCKMVLGVGRDVKNNVALGECGRFPVFIDAYVRVVKYWCRLLTMSDDRYPRQCYKMLCMHDKSGRSNWATHVRKLLCSHGFGYAWEMQTVGNVSQFISMFKCRLMDCFRQEWHDSLSSYPDYCQYHPEILRANYLGELISVEHRRALCLLRCNRLPLNGVNRYNKPIVDPFCKECDGGYIEDLCHFLLVCPKYAYLRKKYIPAFYHRFPSVFKVQLLCSNMNSRLAMNVSQYICLCLKKRQL